ncbi:MAG: Uracil-DNA glycosylase superfamily [Deltaproteobacteria bacterium]|nr:Uracil-DNA glycosylase superfamily [Deltaproteobacteria bacterium]
MDGHVRPVRHSATVSALVQLKRHVTRLRACDACPEMIRPVVSGDPVLSTVMLIGQAPGVREGPAGKPFAWTAGKTMFGWFEQLGMSEQAFRERVYMAAVCRCFPGKAEGGGDRVPSDEEVERCSRHLAAEVRILRPQLVIPVGKLAIAQLVPDMEKLIEIVGVQRKASIAGIEFDMIPLPHPSGASTWHRTEPGKTLLAGALSLIALHPAWQALLDPADPQPQSPAPSPRTWAGARSRRVET